MAESAIHMSYVRQIVSFVETIPGCCSELIEADLPSYSGRTTKVLGGFYPDVYYVDRAIIVIGEAKTENDIENSHTYSQISAYIDEALLFKGERHLVFCCSIFALATMKNFVIRLKRAKRINNIEFHFIDSLNRIFSI